jgi:addiction module HigA family antidote
MEPFDLSANALALALRVPATRIGDLLNLRRAITADTALRLARYYGTTPRFWLELQASYDLAQAAADHGALIARDVHPRAA